jgi:hypothetical protein
MAGEGVSTTDNYHCTTDNYHCIHVHTSLWQHRPLSESVKPAAQNFFKYFLKENLSPWFGPKEVGLPGFSEGI